MGDLEKFGFAERFAQEIVRPGRQSLLAVFLKDAFQPLSNSRQ